MVLWKNCGNQSTSKQFSVNKIRTPEYNNKAGREESGIQDIIVETFTQLRKGLEYAY